MPKRSRETQRSSTALIERIANKPWALALYNTLRQWPLTALREAVEALASVLELLRRELEDATAAAAYAASASPQGGAGADAEAVEP